MWQSYKTFPELSVTRSWSFCKWKKQIWINHRKENGWLIHSFIKQSWSIASQQAWQGAQPEALSPGSNFLSPQPPARLSCLSLLSARFPRMVDRGCPQLETPGPRAEGARARPAAGLGSESCGFRGRRAGSESCGFRGRRAPWHQANAVLRPNLGSLPFWGGQQEDADTPAQTGAESSEGKSNSCFQKKQEETPAGQKLWMSNQLITLVPVPLPLPLN